MKFIYIVLVITVMFTVFNGMFVSAGDVELPVYDISDVQMLGTSYVEKLFHGVGSDGRLTMPLSEVFKYPTIIATRYFSYFTYEYVPVISYRGLRIDKSTYMSMFQSGWYLKSWVFPHNLNYNYQIKDVYVIVMGQALKDSNSLYSFYGSTIRNVPSLYITSVNDFDNALVFEMYLKPKHVNKLVSTMPSLSELRSSYKSVLSELKTDYRNAKDRDEKIKILFTYYYYVKPAYYVIYTVNAPYVFIVLHVSNYSIKTRAFNYQGDVNLVIPVYSRNYMVLRKMRYGIETYNDFLLLKWEMGRW